MKRLLLVVLLMGGLLLCACAQHDTVAEPEKTFEERLLDGALASLAGVEHGDAELDDLVGEENRLVALWVRGREGTDCPGGAIRWFRGRFCRERCRRGRIARRTSRP